MSYILSWYWDKGDFRDKNEDSFSMQRVRMKRKEAAFLAVCDGIGGLPEGEMSSGFVVQQLTEWFYQEGLTFMKSFSWQQKAADAATAALYEIQQKLELCEKQEAVCCGTTCTMVLFKEQKYVLLHVGDSRAYRIGYREHLLTCDHHSKNALSRCVGGFGFDAPDVLIGKLKKGEQLLLCTDGFYHLLPAGMLKKCLRGKRTDDAYQRLKEIGGFVKSRGEKDNLTAILLYYRGRGKQNG